MTQDEIIRMARETGFSINDGIVMGGASDLKRFAALVAVHEREACAKVCEDIGDSNGNQAADNEAYDCAAAIRARGDK